MKRYVLILINLIRANAEILFIYRASYIFGSFSSIMWAILSLTTITIVTYQSPFIAGWSRVELYIVQGVYSIVFGFMYTFVFTGLERYIEDIKRGDMDFLLLKPVDTQFLISFRFMSFPSLARAYTGISILIIALYMYQPTSIIMNMPFFLILLASSCIVVFSIWFMIATIAIWIIDLPGFSELMFHLTGVTRYPLEIVKTFGNFVFYVLLPLVVVTTVPARAIIEKNDWFLVFMSLGLSMTLLGISRMFFRFALRFYTSASS